MGMDFIALLKCPDWIRVTAAVDSLERQSPPAAQKVRELWRRRGYAETCWHKPTWTTLDLDVTPVPRPTLPNLEIGLATPEDFVLTFGADAVALYHILRWDVFLAEPEWQEAMLDASRAFADLLGATDGIITCDWCSADKRFLEGYSYDDALSHAQGEGADAASLSDLVDVEPDPDTWEYHGYWRFLDMGDMGHGVNS